MNFSDALSCVKAGKTVKRMSCNWTLELVQVISANDGRNIVPLLLCEYPGVELYVFSGGQVDLLANDWELVV